jgi:hypothetical protein
MTETAETMHILSRSLSRLAWGLLLACASLSPSWAQSSAASAPIANPQANGWQRLSAEEKRALAPLASRWSELSELQKGKWIAISHNFDQLPPSDKAVMHARMTDWVKLSPIQRNQARLNFNTLQNLPKDEKKAKWDEYQSLSPEQKRQLSAINQGPAKTTAPSSKPANADRLVAPPRAWQSSPAASAPPSRAPIDKKTLLPIPADVANKPAPSQPEASSARDDASSS